MLKINQERFVWAIKPKRSKERFHLFQGLRKNDTLTVKHKNLRVVGFCFEKNNITRFYFGFAN